jgi:hypothetical protein
MCNGILVLTSPYPTGPQLDNLNFFPMEDILNFLPNERRPQYFGKWEMTSIFWQMEVDLNTFANGR